MTTKWTAQCRIHQRGWRWSERRKGRLEWAGVGVGVVGMGGGMREMDGREVYVGAYKGDDFTMHDVPSMTRVSMTSPSTHPHPSVPIWLTLLSPPHKLRDPPRRFPMSAACVKFLHTSRIPLPPGDTWQDD
ncbi:hypothetical protein E2C01_015108 [Portunus trituberculatus]|uniref:Uncharacterized protein n=1 Tax=Portunus trituberculatus TaxID=210409 RepID=A0A5B7DKG4_PORTR|nr:hypothetical protein [Portunus trituberculatus]